jgi:hypothetical protein
VRQREHNARVVRLVGDAVEELRRKLTSDEELEPCRAGAGASTDWDEVSRLAKRQRRL